MHAILLLFVSRLGTASKCIMKRAYNKKDDTDIHEVNVSLCNSG